jgi:very-short-patch-repair endonuclease
MTVVEKMLWEKLRMHRLDGLGFRRQHPAGPYILDFYCAWASLAVEVDGPHHGDDIDQALHDSRRDAWLAKEGIVVLRLTAAQVTGPMTETLELIRSTARRLIGR